MEFRKPKIAHLSNGIPVVLVEDRFTGTVKVKVTFAVGSRHEPPELAGISHFIEHMVWRGTAKWPEGREINLLLDGFGAGDNAATDREDTSYHVQIESGQLPLAVEVLAEILLNPLFRQEHLDTERTVVLSEASGRLDDKSVLSYDTLYGMLYPADPLGANIIGTAETIGRLTRDDMLRFMALYYGADNVIISVSGAFDEGSALRELESRFGCLPLTGMSTLARPAAPARPEEPTQAGPHVTMVWQDDANQIYLSLGFETKGRDDHRRPALGLLCNILGGMMSSRLMVEVREKVGAVYGIGAHADAHQGTGQMLVMAGIVPEKSDQAIGLIVRELADVRRNGVTAGELARAKSNIRGRTVRHFEGPHKVADFYVKAHLFSGGRPTIEQRLLEYEAVTGEQIQAVADEFFRASLLHAAVVGPSDDPGPLIAAFGQLGD